MADTVDNRRALAEESLRMGDFSNAAELYRTILKGMYATDASFLLGLAQAQAGANDFTRSCGACCRTACTGSMR